MANKKDNPPGKKTNGVVDADSAEASADTGSTFLRPIPKKKVKKLSKRTLDRREQVARLMLAHLTIAQIARKVKSSSWVVKKDQAAILAHWRSSILLNVSALKGRELIGLDKMERDAIDEYETEGVSQQNKQRWMKLALDIKRRRAKLCGLDAPILISAVHTMDKSLREMSDAELDAVLEQHADTIDITPEK